MTIPAFEKMMAYRYIFRQLLPIACLCLCVVLGGLAFKVAFAQAQETPTAQEEPENLSQQTKTQSLQTSSNKRNEQNEKLQGGTTQSGSSWHWITSPWFIVLLIVVIPFLLLYTGKLDPRLKRGRARVTGMIVYAYVFTYLSLGISALPFFVQDMSRYVNANIPAGIVRGCVQKDEDQILPIEITCSKKKISGAEIGNYSWLVNIGGAIHKQFDEEKHSDENNVIVTGGLVVPLYVVVLALMGAAVSMTRRVPEYQRAIRSINRHSDYDDKNNNSDNSKQIEGKEENKAEEKEEKKSEKAETHNKYLLKEADKYTQTRSLLVFQIMQVFSAPLIALTAYFIVSPEGTAASIVIAFLAGFASETILLLLRNFSDRVIKAVGAPLVGEKAIESAGSGSKNAAKQL